MLLNILSQPILTFQIKETRYQFQIIKMDLEELEKLAYQMFAKPLCDLNPEEVNQLKKDWKPGTSNGKCNF